MRFGNFFSSPGVRLYDETVAPEYLKDDPVRAYGEYAFREGVRLGLTLACGTFFDET